MRLMHPLQISVPKRLAGLFASNEETNEQTAQHRVQQACPLHCLFSGGRRPDRSPAEQPVSTADTIFRAHQRRLLFGPGSGIPTQVVNPSVS